MYIKQIIIQGFKSYREQTVVDVFSPRHNVVVGRNGSGKSNFFYAIQFVLSDEFNHLRPEQRQALLHEGTGPRVISAYVEIIFDNADGRIPIDKNEVTLRRVIGSKKDQYFLNKKMVSKGDVLNLLESAGFSRSNPYYIVKQGKINQMATAPDSYRLKLLKEVAGTRVYDDRRKESKLILKDTESKRDKISEFLRTIEERLSSLEEEKEELKEYQKWDKMRRALEYALHDKELKETRKKLEEIEKVRKDSGSVQEELKKDLSKVSSDSKLASKELKEIKIKVHALREERDTLLAEINQFVKERTKLELNKKDLEEEVKVDKGSKERAEKELDRLREIISQKEKELEEIKPKYEEKKRQEEELTRQLARLEQERKELYARQGRSSQFTSKEQRDTWINDELKALNKAIRDKNEQIDRLTRDLQSDGQKKSEYDKQINEMTEEMELQRSTIETLTKSLYELKKDKEKHNGERNELWRQETTLQQTLSTLKDELSRADQVLRSMAGKPILNGRDSVRKVLDIFRDEVGPRSNIANLYYGLVIENFSCEKHIYTAVEVTAGNRLFHHIVDSDKVGTEILKEMNRQHLPGEVTFMPLNRLNVRPMQYPTSQDAIPMVHKLTFEDKYSKAYHYIFGKTLICRSLEVATDLARTSGLDCVTLDGDQVSCKGSLTGGYFNTSRSRLETQQTRTSLLEKITTTEAQLCALKDKLNATDTTINQIVSEMQKLETKLSKAKDSFDKVQADIRLKREELNNIERSKQPKERSLAQLKSSLETMNGTAQGLRNELNQDLMTQLSSQDQQKMDSLNDEIRKINQQNKEAFTSRVRHEAEKNKLENMLTNNLIRRRDELQQALQEISVEDRKRHLLQYESELETTCERITQANTELSKVETELNDKMKKQKTKQSECEKHKANERLIQEKMNEDSKGLDRLVSKQAALQQKVEDCTKKINDLGSLPSDAFDRYATMNSKQLFKQLEKANAELKKYSHVNKKALDQFVSFSEQKEKLMARKVELDSGYEKIRELMQALEQHKDEALQFTFKQVTRYFGEVFQKLVPTGHGTLHLKNTDEDGGRPLTPEVDDDGSTDNYSGVSIKVSFTGNVEMKEMNQLSGGQKSLVALALIFAIQKCDPAPFYLFDEIDQALDAQHRKAVADMICELKQEAQFITTTFRPELLEHADKFYGVKFRNKVSHIECVTIEEARDFVEDDTTHG